MKRKKKRYKTPAIFAAAAVVVTPAIVAPIATEASSKAIDIKMLVDGEEVTNHQWKNRTYRLVHEPSGAFYTRVLATDEMTVTVGVTGTYIIYDLTDLPDAERQRADAHKKLQPVGKFDVLKEIGRAHV